MRNTFAGLDTARKALATQQMALESTLHNVANANTPGFSRQRVEMGATTPTALPGTRGIVGNGVQVDAVIRIRDVFIDYQLRNEYSTYAFREYAAVIFSRLESFFQEPGEGGLKEAINLFYESWQNLTRDVTDSSLRAEVRAAADVLASVLNQFDYSMWQLIQDIDAAIVTSVARVNTYATQIAALNYDIFMIEAEGRYIANDLRDRRDLLLDMLSQTVEIKTMEENNYLTVTVNGIRLISHSTVTRLEAVRNTDTGLHDVHWFFGHHVTLPAEINNGMLGSQLAMKESVQKDYREALNKWVREFVWTINYQHRQGYYWDSDIEDWVQGMDFFTPSGFEDGEGEIQPSAFNIRVNPLIMDGVLGLDLIAAVGLDEDGEGGPFSGNNLNALLIAQTRSNKPLLLEIQEAVRMELQGTWIEEIYGEINLTNTFEEKFAAFLLELGIRADSNYRLFETSSYQTKMLEQRRSSVSDVSLDEEMTNMIRFQQAYAAAARLSSALNDVLTILMDRVFR
jgi:flagellar hook-associated protein 1 FlgK